MLIIHQESLRLVLRQQLVKTNCLMLVEAPCVTYTLGLL